MPGENLSEQPLSNIDLTAANTAQPLTAVSKAKRITACLAALTLPGLGHLFLGRYIRGVVIGLGIIAMFALGLLMDGHLFFPVKGEWLTWFFSFLDSGIGMIYFVCLALDFGFKVDPSQAAKITFEYGNTFLMVAGALNMLATLDTYDIAIGRKA